MKRIIILFVLAANNMFSLPTSNNSLIIAPRVGSIITREQPVIIGIMNDTKKKPLKNSLVTVYANPHVSAQQLGSVVTNTLGIWSYRPNNNHIIYKHRYSFLDLRAHGHKEHYLLYSFQKNNPFINLVM